MKRIFKFCKNYLLLYKWRLFLYILLTIIMSAGSLLSPFIIGDFIDQLITADSINFIFQYFSLFAGINIISIILGYIAGRLYVRLQCTMGYSLNRDIIKKVQRLPFKATQRLDTAYLNQRINNDSNSLIIFSISVVQSILVNAIIIVATLFLLYLFHPAIATFLLVVAFIYFVFFILFRNALYRVSYDFQEAQSHFFSKLQEQLFNMKFIKLHSLYDHFINRLNIGFSNLLTGALTHQKTNYIFGSLDQIVMIVAQMVLMLFGGIEIINGRLTIGRFIIISSYFNMMLGAIRYFLGMGKTLQSHLVSYNRLQEFVQMSQELNGNQTLDKINHIELKDLCFSYDNQGIIKNVNISFEKGKKYAILGSNGTGKSTLLDIMMGLHTGDFNGQVKYNGLPLDEINMYDLRSRLIGVSEQEPTLLSDTLEYNLSFDNENLIERRRNELNKLIGILQMQAYIQALPNQLNSVISEQATNLSGGEKQKLSILRTFLKNPDVIVLDEPTSALDESTRDSLAQYIDEIKHEKIIIVVTHDMDFIRSYDGVLKLS